MRLSSCIAACSLDDHRWEKSRTRSRILKSDQSNTLIQVSLADVPIHLRHRQTFDYLEKPAGSHDKNTKDGESLLD